jgi:hypothetical protein
MRIDWDSTNYTGFYLEATNSLPNTNPQWAVVATNSPYTNMMAPGATRQIYRLRGPPWWP